MYCCAFPAVVFVEGNRLNLKQELLLHMEKNWEFYQAVLRIVQKGHR
jgi:hypothetical protein